MYHHSDESENHLFKFYLRYHNNVLPPIRLPMSKITLSSEKSYQKCVKTCIKLRRLLPSIHAIFQCFHFHQKQVVQDVISNDAFCYKWINFRLVWIYVEFIATPGHGFFFGSRRAYFGG